MTIREATHTQIPPPSSPHNPCLALPLAHFYQAKNRHHKTRLNETYKKITKIYIQDGKKNKNKNDEEKNLRSTISKKKNHRHHRKPPPQMCAN